MTIITLFISQADIHLTLRNRGEEAYKPEEYGPCITVVRSIRKDGASTYKLKNSRSENCSCVI